MDGRDKGLAGARELIGRRVALRHRVAEPGGPGPHLSDAVGDLSDGGTAADGARALRVATRRGPVVVRDDDVVAVRAVPPAAPRRASWSAVAHLERICADAWPADVRRDIGEWRLRAGAGGFSRRANSALAIGNPGMPVPDALAEVRRFAAEHGIPPVVAAPDGSPYWRAVRERGWDPAPDEKARSIVMVAEADALGSGSDVRAGATTVFHGEPGPEWSAVSGEPDAAAGPRRSALVPDGLPLGFGTARRDGDPVGAVRVAIVADHAYLSNLAVAPHARRAGVASDLTAAAARWAAGHGARHVVLQVLRANGPARELYQRLGCVEHHRYDYLVPSEP